MTTAETFTIVIPVTTDEITMDDMREIAPHMWRELLEDAGGTPLGEPTVERVAQLVDPTGRPTLLPPDLAWAARAVGLATRRRVGLAEPS